jgi:hypothetical protein
VAHHAPYSLKQRLGVVTDTRYQKLRVASTWVRKLRQNLVIPEFSVTATWLGASEIVKKLNFSLDNSISLPKFLQEIPDSPRYCACVSWKPTSTTIVRYKLWEDVGEILYVDLYNGETIPADFSIEIWNVKPTSSTVSNEIITEDGLVLVTESEDTLVTEDAGSLIGSSETFDIGGFNFQTSKLLIPEDKCDKDDRSLSTDVEECTDLIFELTGWNPFRGDYYVIVGDCGVTQLIAGAGFEGTEIILQSTDETWHRVYLMRFGGITHLVIDQDNAAASDTPYIHLRIGVAGNIKIDLMALNGNHHIRISQTLTADETDLYSILYLQTAEDSLYYGVRAVVTNGTYHLQIAQTNSTL